MNLFSLISNNNLQELELIDYLLSHNKTTVCDKQLVYNLDTSKFIIHESANRLMQKLLEHPELGLKLAIDNSEGHDAYQILNSTATNVNQLYDLYLHETLQYQILMYLFDKFSYNVPQLADKLNISESTLFRQTGHLNHKLSEFGIKIKNGRIYGSELQIVHFYYLFLWSTCSLVQFKTLRKESETQNIIKKLETILDTNFSAQTSLSLALWLKVCQSRLKLVNEFKENEYDELLKDAFQDPLYHKILQAYNSTAVTNITNLNKKNSLYLYLFIITDLIRDNQNQLVLRKINQASWKNPFIVVNRHVDWIFTTAFKQLKLSNYLAEENLKEKWQPLFTQLFNQHYLFKGQIIFSFSDYWTHKYKKSWNRSNLATPLITILKDQSLETIDQTTNRDYLELTYSHFFNFFLDDAMYYKSDKKLIGLYSKHGVPYLKKLKRDFEHKLQPPNKYQIEIATSTQNYDLFIADSPYFLETFKFKNSYLLKDFYSEKDLDNLETFVCQIAATDFHQQNVNQEG
ncbi:helix-turn-helix domain-containing protein [Lapidilactobacillus dextrinicus]|uniref:helix-turn-helix domain-containing protein n=1 Tax=Lapidilactobacillus dextrinicus TaxID=51664 RepID=UPI0007104B4E|nr:helix-turn-helix domain-containing protein [Lapidilactobacillus dextrinicus]